jgi:hypothetical protein
MKTENPESVTVSSQDRQITEVQNIELVKLRFCDLFEDDLVDSYSFFEDLDSGKYDF